MSERHAFSSLRATVAGIVALLIVAPTADAHARDEPVTAWARHHATPMDTVDPARPIDDLEPIRRSVDGAVVVGLGESVHGAAEETLLKHRVLRVLVERMGFRTVAWEEDWTTGVEVDRFISSEEGDLGALMDRMSDQYQTREVAQVLRWLRRHNAAHAAKVRFVGVESYYTQPWAYDAVEAYVAEHAPQRLRELQERLAPIRPDTSNMKQYAEDHFLIPSADKARNARDARAVHELVAGLPHAGGDRAHALVLHHALQIRSFHEYYAQDPDDANQRREEHAAANLRWWRRYSGGHRVAYWAASPHTAAARDLHIVLPAPYPAMRFASAGSHLRRWYGNGYRSIGFTFDHGAVSLGGGQTADQPPPKPGWFERPFGAVAAEQFTLDLRSPAPPPVRDWLERPVTTRGVAQAGLDGFIEGGSLEEWFDVIVHRQTVSPAADWAATPAR